MRISGLLIDASPSRAKKNSRPRRPPAGQVMPVLNLIGLGSKMPTFGRFQNVTRILKSVKMGAGWMGAEATAERPEASRVQIAPGRPGGSPD